MNRLLTIVDSKYQRLEYLESTGTQWIQTDYVPNINDVIECDVQKTGQQDTNDAFFFGQQTIDTNKGGLWAEQYGTGNAWYVRFSGTSSATYNSSEQDRTEKIHITLDKNRFKTSGGTNIDLTVYYTGQLQSSPLTLFCRWNTAGTQAGFSKLRYWNFRVTNNGVTKLNLVPVLRKTDNELGMLDLVEGKFYPNAGTGKFTANLDTMYAIIQGSPTQSPYGVFSGFSASNYLEIPKFDKTSAWEMVYCFRTSNSIDDMKGKGIIQENVTTSYKTRVNISIAGTGISIFMSSTGTSFDIGQVGVSNVIDINTKYFLKVKFTGTQYIWSLKSTGDYSVIATINSSTILRDSTYKLGTEASNGFTGSIDLNNSYIKLGSTKYNLQAVVGYTIVGSPTIVDGVLINPTSSNFLIIDKYLSADRIEVSIPFSFDTLNWNDIFWGKRTQQQNVLLEITSGGVMRIYFNQGIPSYFDTARLNININYRIDITLTYDNFAYKIINEDSNIIVKEDLKERTTKAIPYLDIPCFGRNATNSKIAIKDTIIKADNKLWFNGQEA